MLGPVFERLIAAGLTLKPSKYDSLRKDLKVLGYVVTRDGVKPNPEEVNAIKMFQGFRFNEEVGVYLYQSHTGNALYAVKLDSDELLATIPCERGDAKVYGHAPSVSVARGEGSKESTKKHRCTKLSKHAGGGSSNAGGVSSGAGGGGHRN
eukprot:6199793-Pleurochrysis_carterae.AAC.1